MAEKNIDQLKEYPDRKLDLSLS